MKKVLVLLSAAALYLGTVGSFSMLLFGCSLVGIASILRRKRAKRFSNC